MHNSTLKFSAQIGVRAGNEVLQVLVQALTWPALAQDARQRLAHLDRFSTQV